MYLLVGYVANGLQNHFWICDADTEVGRTCIIAMIVTSRLKRHSENDIQAKWLSRARFIPLSWISFVLFLFKRMPRFLYKTFLNPRSLRDVNTKLTEVMYLLPTYIFYHDANWDTTSNTPVGRWKSGSEYMCLSGCTGALALVQTFPTNDLCKMHS